MVESGLRRSDDTISYFHGANVKRPFYIVNLLGALRWFAKSAVGVTETSNSKVRKADRVPTLLPTHFPAFTRPSTTTPTTLLLLTH